MTLVYHLQSGNGHLLNWNKELHAGYFKFIDGIDWHED